MKTVNKYLIIAASLVGVHSVYGQSAFDCYSLSQSDLRGTARFTAMAGAFGALGGDLSVLNQNPGGIGIYRSSDIGVTLNWNIQNVKAGKGYDQFKTKETNFNFNNVAYVGVYNTDNDACPNFNWGFSYNRKADLNRHYYGEISNIPTSMSNYVAGQANIDGYTIDELGATRDYDPYYETNAPWMSILAYNSYLINPLSENTYQGLMDGRSLGYSQFEVDERGQIDEYTISFGGNVYNTLYWGASLGIIDYDYSAYTYYGENIQNAIAPYDDRGNGTATGVADWGIENNLNVYGTGVNFKIGLIAKPINELRLGLAFHTPTFYSLTSEYWAGTSYYLAANGHEPIDGFAETNDGYYGHTDFEMRSPWKVIASAAGVIGGRAILSFDFEHTAYPNMQVSYDGREDRQLSDCINRYYKGSETIRLGAEFKVTPQFSVRAGYSYQTSPFTDDIKNGNIDVQTAGTTLSYVLDDNIQHITAGVGYRYKKFYADLAYVYKQREGKFVAFSPDENSLSPTAPVKDNNSEVTLSVGFRF